MKELALALLSEKFREVTDVQKIQCNLYLILTSNRGLFYNPKTKENSLTFPVVAGKLNFDEEPSFMKKMQEEWLTKTFGEQSCTNVSLLDKLSP